MIGEAPWGNLPVLAKSAGLDFIIVDTEHGGFDYGVLSSMLMNARLADLFCIVRLGDNSRKEITRLMDMGAAGLLLPMTETAEDIKAVVRYAKYSPAGKRGVSTTRAHSLYNPGKLTDYMRSANENSRIFAQIETKKGLANLEEILSADGVDGVFLGPNDLACDLDCFDNPTPILEAIKAMAACAGCFQKESGIITAEEAFIRKAKESGMKYIGSGSEISILKQGFSQVKERIQ